VENRLWEQEKNHFQLTKDLQMKEEKLHLLRAEAITYQFRNLPLIENGKSSTKEDCDRVEDENDDFTSSDDEPSSLADLTDGLDAPTKNAEQQVQDMKEILVMKDRELLEQKKDFERREQILQARLDEALATNKGSLNIGHVQFFL